MRIWTHGTTVLEDAGAYLKRLRALYGGLGGSSDTLSTDLWFNLLRTFGAASTRVTTRVGAHGLTPAGLNVLGLLAAHRPQGLPLNVLSRSLMVSRANVTGLVDSLVRRGYVRRVDHASDRRVCLAQITTEGDAWLKGYLPGHFRAVTKMVAHLTRTERVELSRLLTKLRQGILAYHETTS